MPQSVIVQDGVFSSAVRKQINENFAQLYESYGSVPEYDTTGDIPTYTDAVALGVVNDLLYQKLPDGTVSQVGGGGNPFDQDLNTTDAVEFLSLALDDGNGNMLIGEGAAPDDPGDTNSIVIGDGAIGRGSNTVQIGNGSIDQVMFGVDDGVVDIGKPGERLNAIYVSALREVIEVTAGGLGYVSFTNPIELQDYLGGTEVSAPSTPSSNGFRIYAEDNGAGKTRLMCLFSSGAAQQLAIQP